MASGLQPPSGVGTHSHALSDLQSAITSITNAIIPVGLIAPYYGTSAPTNWLLCDGSAIPSQYTALIALVGANTPNLKGKVVVGYNAAETEFDTLAETGGSKTSTAAHTHTLSAHTHQHDHGHTISDPGHGHGNTNTNGAHAHSPSGFNNWVIERGAVEAQRIPDAGSTSNGVYVTYTASVPNVSSSHAHGTGSTTTGITQTVTTASPANTNLADPDVSGASSVGAVSGNLQPYMALSYIIKAA